MPPNIKTPGPSNVPKDDSVTSAKIADGAIVNADVNASAAIARTKLASGTASHVVINDDSGVLSSEATLAVTRGGTGAATAADARTNLELGGAATLNVGTTTGTVAAGDDSRFPTADQKAALAGTGTPGAGNVYVTDDDSRLTDDRTASGLRSATTVVSVSAATAPTAGQVLTATGDSAATWQDPSGGGGGGGMSRIATSTQPSPGGYWLLTPAPLTSAAQALTADTWVATYFYSGQGGTLASLGVYQTTGSGNLRICIYNLDDARYPSTLLANSDTGSFASSSGFCMASVSCTLAEDTYYAVAINVDSSFSVRRPNNHSSDVNSINSLGLLQYGWTVAQTFGAPDANFPGSATSVTQTSTPMFFYLLA